MPEPLRLKGIAASGGYAEGPLFPLHREDAAYLARGTPQAEAEALRAALAHATARIGTLMATAAEESAAILEFQLAMLDDKALTEPAFAAIAARRRGQRRLGRSDRCRDRRLRGFGRRLFPGARCRSQGYPRAGAARADRWRRRSEPAGRHIVRRRHRADPLPRDRLEPRRRHRAHRRQHGEPCRHACPLARRADGGRARRCGDRDRRHGAARRRAWRPRSQPDRRRRRELPPRRARIWRAPRARQRLPASLRGNEGRHGGARAGQHCRSRRRRGDRHRRLRRRRPDAHRIPVRQGLRPARRGDAIRCLSQGARMGRRQAGHHPHRRCRRRQAGARLHRRGEQSVPRPARHQAVAGAPRYLPRADPRAAARRAPRQSEGDVPDDRRARRI